MAVNKRKILESAQKFLQKGALDKALKEYRTLLDVDPRDSSARLKLGDIHLRLGEKDDAVAAYLKVAHQFMKDGFDAKAVALFKQIAKLAPEQIEVHVPLAELYQRLGLTPEAMSALQTAVEAFQKAGRKREALELLRKAAALDPTNTTSRLKIADLLRAQGMAEEALTEYEEVAAELERHDDAGVLAGVYERMLELEPDRLSALLALARISLREAAPERALELAQRAEALRPDLMDAVQLHAEALQATGRSIEEQEPVWRRLAEMHHARGDEAGGRAILQRFCSSYDLTQNGVDLGNAQGEGVALTPDAAKPRPGELTLAAEKLGPSLLPPADDLLFGSPAAAKEKAPVPPAPVTISGEADVDQLLAEAGVYLRFGKRERAIASLEAVLAREPDHPGALEKLAGALAHDGDVARATTLLARGVAALEARGDVAGAGLLRSRIGEIDPLGAESAEGPVLEEIGDAALVDFEPEDRHGEASGPGLPPVDVTVAPASEASHPPDAAGARQADEDESPFELEVELDFSDADPELPELEAVRPVCEAAEPAGSRVLEIHEAEALPEPEIGPAAEEISAEGIEVALHEALPEIEIPDEVALVLEEPPALVPEPLPVLTLEDAADEVALEGEIPVAAEDARADTHAPSEAEEDDDSTGESHGEDDEPPIIELDEPSTPSLPVSPKQILEDLEEGDFYFQQSLLDEAEAVYRRVLEAAPTNPQALLRLGEIAAARGDDPAGARHEATWAQNEAAEAAERFEATQPSVATAGGLEPGFGDDLAEWEEETVAVSGATGDATLVGGPAGEASDAAEASPVVLDASAAEETAAVTASGREISHFDLAAELSDDLGLDASAPAGQPTSAPTADSEPSLEAIFSEFKRGVQKTLTEADHETHYDLGIAYREMGLYDDAMSEFRIALESPARRLDCLHLLGLCARDLKRPQDAVAFLRQALADGGLVGEGRLSTLFDLSLALEEAGDAAEALATLDLVAAEAPDHPGLAERVEALRALQTLSPAEPTVEATAESPEVFESFDDLIADAEAAFAAGGPERPPQAPPAARPEPPPDRPSPAPPRGTPPRRRKISFG